ncbi:BZ3500_MvSof-1268-A1-R1_Chr9g10544 [Microbotryum saponariae]|uniref:BZ3500_MvSof-1268-A1-R1_Chr9g10544 protein n=1 Tax=Microbotryum saponariae TaxID=289078 RepID=A0A2X0K955_9BASI|nr:BZ3501_MvSof-1269-A2-R1_Chr9g10293 [Microbotryum saponariae]SDA00269.1 BZ3500_MvSof-1268-A1-R1_Chr9g10544 [Microbotryum saponariae]
MWMQWVDRGSVYSAGYAALDLGESKTVQRIDALEGCEGDRTRTWLRLDA